MPLTRAHGMFMNLHLTKNGIAAVVVGGLVICLATACNTTAPTKSNTSTSADEHSIRAVLDHQLRDWNQGNIEGFMQGYHRSISTRFASAGTVHLGWDKVLERYRTRYPDRAAMGTTTFSEVDIQGLSPDAALVFGRWHLQRATNSLGGLFTLLFRKTHEGWKIVHDHTSSAGP